MKKTTLVLVSIAAVVFLALTGCVPFWGPPTGGGVPQQPYPYASGGQQPYPYGPGGGMGPGMMGGGGMGPGMMGGGGWGGYNPQYGSQTRPISIDEAADYVRRYLSAYGGKLTLTEVMDFARNFYAEVEEKDTGTHAIELLIDKYTGRVSPEMGPNMMWNTKYSPMAGMMGNYGGGSPTANMPVGAEQARTIAQRYLDTNLPGVTVEAADTFYGYYTLHTEKGGEIEGMLSVNGYTGAVWYHTWHGPFIAVKEYHQ